MKRKELTINNKQEQAIEEYLQQSNKKFPEFVREAIQEKLDGQQNIDEVKQLIREFYKQNKELVETRKEMMEDNIRFKKMIKKMVDEMLEDQKHFVRQAILAMGDQHEMLQGHPSIEEEPEETKTYLDDIFNRTTGE